METLFSIHFYGGQILYIFRVYCPFPFNFNSGVGQAFKHIHLESERILFHADFHFSVKLNWIRTDSRLCICSIIDLRNSWHDVIKFTPIEQRPAKSDEIKIRKKFEKEKKVDS